MKLVKTLVRKVDFGGRYIKEGTTGCVIDSWVENDQNIYAVNFGKIWSVAYREDELEVIENEQNNQN